MGPKKTRPELGMPLLDPSPGVLVDGSLMHTWEWWGGRFVINICFSGAGSPSPLTPTRITIESTSGSEEVPKMLLRDLPLQAMKSEIRGLISRELDTSALVAKVADDRARLDAEPKKRGRTRLSPELLAETALVYITAQMEGKGGTRAVLERFDDVRSMDMAASRIRSATAAGYLVSNGQGKTPRLYGPADFAKSLERFLADAFGQDSTEASRAAAIERAGQFERMGNQLFEVMSTATGDMRASLIAEYHQGVETLLPQLRELTREHARTLAADILKLVLKDSGAVSGTPARELIEEAQALLTNPGFRHPFMEGVADFLGQQSGGDQELLMGVVNSWREQTRLLSEESRANNLDDRKETEDAKEQ